MRSQELAVFLRMLERMLIVAGGIFTIFLGYRLFTLGIDKSQGEAIAFGMTLRQFGPGLFFAGVGAFILVTAARAAIRTGPLPASASAGAAGSEIPAPSPAPFFFGVEDAAVASQWSAKEFLLETRDLLRRVSDGRPQAELIEVGTGLRKKLDTMTMSPEEYTRFRALTSKAPLTDAEERELVGLERKLVP
jgi:hypothetical protein